MAETQETGTSKKIGTFFSPEAIIMLSLALFVDVGEALIEFVPVIGQVASIILDIIAVVVIGGWMWFRSGTIKVTAKTGARMAKAGKWAKRMKWLRPIGVVIECIPGIGSLPLWLVLVYLELKYS